jgi:hypothetical protein
MSKISNFRNLIFLSYFFVCHSIFLHSEAKASSINHDSCHVCISDGDSKLKRRCDNLVDQSLHKGDKKFHLNLEGLTEHFIKAESLEVARKNALAFIQNKLGAYKNHRCTNLNIHFAAHGNPELGKLGIEVAHNLAEISHAKNLLVTGDSCMAAKNIEEIQEICRKYLKTQMLRR